MESYNVNWTSIAIGDLRGIVEYISYDSREVAKQQYSKIKSAASTLTDFPKKGRIVPELKIHNIEKYRELIISPWRLIYTIERKSVFVLALIDGRRNIEYILLERNLR